MNRKDFNRISPRWILALALAGSAVATNANAQTTGNTVALADYSSPITEGRIGLWSNGETRTWGHLQTLPNGTQVFPRLSKGGTSASGTVNTPAVQYWSLDANGLTLYRIESASSTASYSPARVYLPPSLTVGQTYESLYTQTNVSAADGTSTSLNIKEITTIVGLDTVVTPMGSYPALKVAKQTLAALPDGSFPAASTVGTSYNWFGNNGAGIIKIVNQNADGSIASSQSLFAVDTLARTAPAPGAAFSGSTVALTDIANPFTEGHATLWTNGETRTWGHPQTLPDGTQIFPRLHQGGTSASGTVNAPAVQYWSLDANGVTLYRIESASSTVSYSPARVYLPPSLTVGQTYESLYMQTNVSTASGTSTSLNIKEITTIVGFDTVVTPMGSYPALKVAKQTLVALPDGTFPAASTVGTSYNWFANNGVGAIKIINQNADGSIASSQSLFALDTLAGTAPAPGAAFSGSTVALTDIASPFAEGHATLWSNGETRTWGHPQTLPDGTQVFPRLSEGGASASGTVNTPAVQYWSLNANGLTLYRIESASSTASYSPARVYLPPSLTVGQTYESLYTQTNVSTASGTSTTLNIKEITTIVGLDTVVTPMGSYPALKVAKQTLAALPDGSFPAASTVGTSYNWFGNNGAGTIKIVNQNADGSIASSQSLFAVDTLNGTQATAAALVAGWNLLGNGLSQAVTVSSLLGDSNTVNTVWKWMPSTSNWAFYTPTLSDGGAAYAASKGYAFLSTINGGEGFWVNAKSASSIPLSGNPVTTSTFADGPVSNALPTGWSLIAIGDNKTPQAFANAIALNPPAVGAAVATSLTTLWAWNPSSSGWYFFAPSLLNDGTQASYIASKSYLDFGSKILDPTTGFWVNKP